MSRTLPVQMHLTYSDLAVYFSEEEWNDLEGWQKEMYKEVMRDNYENLHSLGIQVPKPDVFLKFHKGKKDVREAILPDAGSTNEKQVGPKLQPIVLQPQDLIMESKEKTSEGKSQMCRKCGDLEDCLCYVYKSNSKKPYSCIDCGKSYRKHSLLIVHQRSHFKGQAYKCEYCEKSFLKPSHLQRHLKTHQKYKCPECEECFRNLTLFYKHVKSQHKGRGYRCHTCQEVFQFRADVIKHQGSHKTVHQCEQCMAVYTRLGFLQKHMSSHFPQITKSHGTCSSENGDIQKFSHTTTSHGRSISENLHSPVSISENRKSHTFPQTTSSHGSSSLENIKIHGFPQTTTGHGTFSSENEKTQMLPQTTTSHGSYSENRKTQTSPQTTTQGSSSSEIEKFKEFPQTTTGQGIFSSETLTRKFLHREEKNQKIRGRKGSLSSNHVHEVKQNRPLKKEVLKRIVGTFSFDQALRNFKTKAKISRQTITSEELPQTPQSQHWKTMKNTNPKQQVIQNTKRNVIAPSAFSPHKVGLMPQPMAPTSKNILLPLKPNTYVEKAELFSCKKCKKRYRHRKSLFRHKKSHTQRYMCHTCGETFPRLVLVYLHRMVHTEKKRYNCRFCMKRFSIRSLLLLHRKTHRPWKPDLLLNVGQEDLVENTDNKCHGQMFSQSSGFTLKQLNAMENEVPMHLKEPHLLVEHSYNCTPAPVPCCMTIGTRPLQETCKCRDYVKKICYRAYDSRDSN
ncbi:zinc finger protein 90 isoform X2 [Xenopus laevis]|uniref:Uncharacterized protein n=2 Tax=Xenopus laevis TaxID=8355 RepID=A0A974HEV7_XENLA|nr:zinc finger protein 90 isoform X2 [Xenopus laevis]OCT75333.1 hypothetical protein XELAEV_18030512mg [Xenopus laevis]